jgi:peptide/nickel transport system permease protein
LLRYVIGRIGQAIVVLFGLSILAFLLIHLVPGDPVRLVLGPRATPAAVRTLTRQLGLQNSWQEQYWQFVSHAARGRFGTSISTSASVGSLIGPRLAVSALLIVYALLVAVVVAVPAAVIAAIRPNRAVDHSIRVASTATFAMPTFWLGLILVLVFSLRLGLFPVSGYGDSFVQHVYHLTLPAVAVGLAVAPLILRVLRASLIATLEADYIEAARARGFSTARITLKHALKNSILAPLTILSILVGVLLSGTVVAESVFALPGLGSLLVTSVVSRDYPTVQALVLIFGVTVVLVNLATDLLYPIIDHRVHL